MCVTEGNLTRLCQEHVDERIDEFRAAHPGLLEKYGSGGDRCSHCIELDIADEYDYPTASEWASLRWLLA